MHYHKESPIILVDDEDAALRTMELALCIEGYTNIRMFNSWKKAFYFINSNETELLLLDIIMPELSGIDALRECRLHFPHLPVVMVTGVNDVENAVQCMKLGAVDYLTKPLDNSRFIDCIKNVINTNTQQKTKSLKKEKFNCGQPEHCLTISDRLASLDHILNSIIEADPTRLQNDEDQRVQVTFNDIMQNQKEFLNPELSLDTVALKMNSNIVYVRTFLKKVYNVNFRLYINALRIREFVRLAYSTSSTILSIDGLCRSAGFARRATFYDAFKTITGSTPGAWLDHIDNQKPA